MSEAVAGNSSSDRTEESEEEMMVYKKNACRVLTFHIIYDENDLESNNKISFKPEMAHQIFGESESIFGYRDVHIAISLLHNSCQCYLDLKTSGKINKPNIKADDVLKTLNSWLPSNFTQSYEEFLQWAKDEKHDVMYGDVVKRFEGRGRDSKPTTYLITKNDTSNKEFQDFHARFETYIIWFIDAANYIDLDDEKWLIFYVYEEFKHPVKNCLYRTPVAFCTIYNFYAYPDKKRPRISQFFVLPPYQKLGIGTTLFETVAKILRADNKVVDLAVEEPTPCFQKIRDLEDCGLMYLKIAEENLQLLSTSSKKISSLAHQLKIGRRQIQRVYDILTLYYASKNGASPYKRTLDNIKTRIILEAERQCSPGKRFRHIDLKKGGISKEIENKKEEAQMTFTKYCDEIQPSVEYLNVKLNTWLERNK